MKPSSTSPARGAALGRLLAYYGLFGLAVGLAARYLPPVRAALVAGDAGLSDSGVAQIFGPATPPAVGLAVEASPWSVVAVAAISMVGALAIMVPVTWVYMVTRRRRGWDESVVHTLLILPVAVAGIVMVVKNSVALAFSLAGIVAAVRFRTTLDDTKDAVYVFLAIGVGLACGVQSLSVAIVLSIVFNAIVLVLWRTRFGNFYATGGARVGLGDVLAGPTTAESALRVGDPTVLEAASPADLADIADRAVRIERHLSEERAKKKTKRANALILVHAPNAQPAQAYVEGVLAELTTRYKLVEVGPGPRGVTLEYLARVDAPAVQGAIMDRLREGHGGAVSAAELRSLKGLSPRT